MTTSILTIINETNFDITEIKARDVDPKDWEKKHKTDKETMSPGHKINGKSIPKGDTRQWELRYSTFSSSTALFYLQFKFSDGYKTPEMKFDQKHAGRDYRDTRPDDKNSPKYNVLEESKEAISNMEYTIIVAPWESPTFRLEAHYGPVDFPIVNAMADHTYVCCYDQAGVKIDVYECFGGQSGEFSNVSSPTVKSTVEVFKVNDVRGKRDSTRMDYLIHGVCHQAANRFLHPSQIAMVQRNGEPKGLVVSTLLYGLYGNDYYEGYHKGDGDVKVEGIFHKTWRENYYDPTCFDKRLCIYLDTCDTSTDEGSLWYDAESTYRKHCGEENTMADVVVRDTGIVLRSYLPHIQENPIAGVQREILRRWMDHIRAAGVDCNEHGILHVPAFTRESVIKLVKAVNDLAKALQAEFKTQLGDADFALFMGTDKFIDLVSEDYALEVLLG